MNGSAPSTATIAAMALVTMAVCGLASTQISDDIQNQDWAVLALNSDMAQARQVDRQLQERIDATIDRVNRKQEIVDDLIANRINLLDAAREFRKLNSASPCFAFAIRYQFPTGTLDECQIRSVIDLASRRLEGRPIQVSTVSRLLYELETMRTQDGEVRFD